MSPDELSFMQRFKVDERRVSAGTRLLTEGEASAELYTVLNGMGLRFKSLENGSRQVLAFVLPGDFLGLQAGVMAQMMHSVEARTDMTVCVFRREALWQLFASHPERGFDLAWLAAVEEHFLGDSLAALGQMPAMERLGRGLCRVFARGEALGLVRDGRMPLPFIQQDLADGLGLSLVHTNKLLRQLRQRGIASWSDGLLHVQDTPGLAENAQLSPDFREPLRPLI